MDHHQEVTLPNVFKMPLSATPCGIHKVMKEESTSEDTEERHLTRTRTWIRENCKPRKHTADTQGGRQAGSQHYAE